MRNGAAMGNLDDQDIAACCFRKAGCLMSSRISHVRDTAVVVVECCRMEVAQGQVVQTTFAAGVSVYRKGLVAVGGVLDTPVGDPDGNALTLRTNPTGGVILGIAGGDGARIKRTARGWYGLGPGENINTRPFAPNGVFPDRTRGERIVVAGNDVHRAAGPTQDLGSFA